jgi:GrpB-like predicted nucleotidyltransferase (UPF0157 family)
MNKYIFKIYNQRFPALFLTEKTRIATYIKHHLAIDLIIEHIGSTAVPNLGGKGIIDIALSTNKTTIDAVSEELKNLGYEFREIGSSSERWFFQADLPDLDEKVRRYHIHLTLPESIEWKNLIAFRDYLRANPKTAKKYENLKRRAVQEAHHDGSKYRQLKEPMIQEILKKI